MVGGRTQKPNDSREYRLQIKSIGTIKINIGGEVEIIYFTLHQHHMLATMLLLIPQQHENLTLTK